MPTDAGVEGGQGRSPERVKESTVFGGIALAGIPVLIAIAWIVQVIKGC
jgi:hypothetical protein